MATKKEEVFNLRIFDIRVVQFSQFDLLKDFDESKIPLVEYQTNFSFKVFEKEGKIGCLTNIKVKVYETDEYFADVKVEIIFEVSPFEVAAKFNNGKFDISNSLLFNIASVSVSTCRGILYERFKGSIIQKEVYPLADLSGLFPSDK